MYSINEGGEKIMKFKRLTALLCAAAMITLAVAGCGKEASKDVTDKSTSSETVGDETYDTQALENAGEITLTMMVSGTETENDFDTVVFPNLVKEKWPNVTIEVTKLPDDSYYTALKTKLASGECPDIILVQPMYAGANACYSLAEAGYLASLDDMSCLANYKDNEAMTYNGNVYGLSRGVSILGAFYNQDMFEECGITEVPQTWDEFLNACEKIKAKGHQPIVMGDKDQYVLQFGLYQLAANEIYSQDQEFDNKLRTEETSFKDEGTWDRVLEMYYELYENQYIDSSQSLGLSASQAVQEFIDGNAAMTLDGSFNATALLADGAGGDFARGYFPMPGDKGDVYTATCQSAGLAIYSKSKYISECKELLDYLLDGESKMWEAMISTGKYIMTYGKGVEAAPNYELFKPFVDLMNEGKAYHWCNQSWPAGTEVTMEELFSEMIGGQGTTIEEITQGMQDKFEDLLDE